MRSIHPTTPRVSTVHEVLASHLVGGAGIIAARLARAARERQIPSMSWVPGRGPASESLDREGLIWRTYNLEAMRNGTFRHLTACARMAIGLFGRPRPIVHVHNPVIYRFIRPALVAVNARVVVHFQIEPTDEEVRWTLRFPPDQIVACAQYIAAKIAGTLAQGGVVVPVSALPNAIDLVRFSRGSATKMDLRRKLSLPTDRYVLLMLANLAPHKGQATVIRAVEILRSRGFPVDCWLVGEERGDGGSYEAELRQLCSALGVQDIVRFLGFRLDGPDLLRAADVFLLPSTHEGLPLSILEAQAARVPVIGAPIPGILEVVEDGMTGFVVPADDPTGYADRIQLLCEREDIRGRILDAAAAQVERDYGWTTFEARMFSLYQSLMPQ